MVGHEGILWVRRCSAERGGKVKGGIPPTTSRRRTSEWIVPSAARMTSGGSTRRALANYPWQIGCAHHQEESDQGRFAFAEHNRAAPDDSRICCWRGSLEAGALVLGKDTGEDSTWGEVRTATRV